MEFAEQQIIILDADHFVAGDTIYGMDNTAERYTYGGLEFPEQSIRTFDGHIFLGQMNFRLDMNLIRNGQITVFRSAVSVVRICGLTEP